MATVGVKWKAPQMGPYLQIEVVCAPIYCMVTFMGGGSLWE